MTDDIIVCSRAVLTKAIQDAIVPLVAERNQMVTICQQAINLARDRSDVLKVIHDQNVDLRAALMRLLDSPRSTLSTTAAILLRTVLWPLRAPCCVGL